MTVWAVHPIKYDVSAAKRFGDLRYINKGYVFGDELTVDTEGGDGIAFWTIPDSVHNNLLQAAIDFNPMMDCVLIIGDHLQLMQFAAILLTRHQYVDVLRYDRKIADYVPVRLHSTLVFTPRPVLGSPPHIGDTDGQESPELTLRSEVRVHPEWSKIEPGDWPTD